MILSNDLRPGRKIELNGTPYLVVEYQHHKPGKGGAMVRTKLRNLRSGALVDRTFRPDEKLSPAPLEERRAQFLYRQGDDHIFMDVESYEQFGVTEKQLGEAGAFLKEEMEVTILFYHQEVIGVDLPIAVELTVVETEPGVRGDTVSGGSKPATLETGATIQVPLFIDVETRVRVDTRTGTYMGRA
ncbi:MAG: elongation factor P [candidate division NC10 bacterium]|jgi:elongation factor P|nr:elongation factor P [candidate division NC10 bacterium]MCH7895334.1 elongation factor P [candidate division NC10 bacterium]MCZ6552055.1 elongation factor P [candidate division NC10 bacterium]